MCSPAEDELTRGCCGVIVHSCAQGQWRTLGSALGTHIRPDPSLRVGDVSKDDHGCKHAWTRGTTVDDMTEGWGGGGKADVGKEAHGMRGRRAIVLT